MSASLQKRIHTLVRQTLDLYPGSWLVWCDPHGVWTPLLRRVSEDSRMGGLPLLEIAESTAGEAGSLLARRQLQERLDAGESLVLLVHAGPEALGWLWAQSLLAEEVYVRSLREQLLDWGWRPQDLTMSEADLAALARRQIGQDPANWGNGGVQPEPALLLRVLAGLTAPDDDMQAVLDLPIASDELEAAVVNGSWQLRQKGRALNFSVAGERRQWWQTEGHVPAAAIHELTALIDGDVPAPAASKARLVLTDSAIDKLGHDDELAIQGTQAILDRYLTVIGRLRDAGWRRVLLTTDHGYIHWSGTLEQAAPPPAPDAAYSSRRAMAYPAGTLQGAWPLAPGSTYQVAVPSGAATFKAYGGRGYYHGGGSLQEWVIPCFKAEWPAEAKPVEVALQAVKFILSLRQKVKIDVHRPGPFAEDALPFRVEVIVRNATSREILFRSEPRTVTPDQDTVEVARSSTGAVAPRGTPVRIELRDLKTEATKR